MTIPKEITKTCRNCGPTTFVLEGRGYYRCRTCRQNAVAARRRRVKQELIEYLGGQCQCCGYQRFQGALDFHHIDPTTKSFALSHKGLTKSVKVLKQEADKCALLCAVCHREVEAGIRTIPRCAIGRRADC